MIEGVMIKDSNLFLAHFKAGLLRLSTDRVVNVRIQLAQILEKYFSGNGALKDDQEIVNIILAL
jgi:hypothetical protein